MNNSEPVNTIINLNGVTEIQLISLNPKYSEKLRAKLLKKEEINLFLSTFKPTEGGDNSITQLKESEFKKDGEIKVFSNEEVLMVIDFDYGYHVKINSVDYYERFTYRTGRYIAESL